MNKLLARSRPFHFPLLVIVSFVVLIGTASLLEARMRPAVIALNTTSSIAVLSTYPNKSSSESPTPQPSHSSEDLTEDAIVGPDELDSDKNTANTDESVDSSSDDEDITSANSPITLLSVEKVTDGDTFVVEIDGKTEKVRLIGINAPESVDPKTPVQCFGKEASAALTNLINQKQLRLESDPTQGNRDKYNRLLRYAYLSDDTSVNEFMLQHGYAFEYTYKTAYQFQKQFRVDQANAKSQHVGLWNPATCDGKV